MALASDDRGVLVKCPVVRTDQIDWAIRISVGRSAARAATPRCLHRVRQLTSRARRRSMRSLRSRRFRSSWTSGRRGAVRAT